MSDKPQLHASSVLHLGGPIEIGEIGEDEIEEDSDSDSSDDDQDSKAFSPNTRVQLCREGEHDDETVDSALESCCSERMTTFELLNVHMPEIDERILELAWVTEVTCHNNQLTSLPATISSLQLVTTLNITSNNLFEIPAAIGQMKSLTSLDLNRNKLVGLPDEVRQLCNLKKCVLDYNNLQKFPEPLFDLPGLEKICLVENVGITTFGALDQFSAFKKTAVLIDNAPPLMEEWKVSGEKFPGVTVEWNKVFPDRITDHIFIGSLRTAQEQRVYEELGISHVLTCGTGMSVHLCDGMDQLLLPLMDTVEEKLQGHLEKGIEYIKNIAQKDEKVLVHCFAGLSRSASLVCAYLMKENNWTFEKSLECVKAGRPNAQPNDGFRVQLKAYQAVLGITE